MFIRLFCTASRIRKLTHFLSPHSVLISEMSTAQSDSSIADLDIPWALGKVWHTAGKDEPPRLLQTAACLIIGDEVLSGKTTDTNSTTFAKYCFSLGIDLKRIETIADDEFEITEAVWRMSSKYDFVVTSGGIGPTHDDITYPSIAKAFNLPLGYHQPTIDRMKQQYAQSKNPTPLHAWDNPTADLLNRLRMATLPLPDPENNPTPVDYIFPSSDTWVPIVVVNRNIHILPGVPSIFKSLLEALQPILISQGKVNITEQSIHRVLISTPLRESAVADYLTTLQAEADKHGVKIGSYTRWGKSSNTVTLTGRDKEWIEKVVPDVCSNIYGNRVSVEGEDDSESEGDEKVKLEAPGTKAEEDTVGELEEARQKLKALGISKRQWKSKADERKRYGSS